MYWLGPAFLTDSLVSPRLEARSSHASYWRPESALPVLLRGGVKKQNTS